MAHTRMIEFNVKLKDAESGECSMIPFVDDVRIGDYFYTPQTARLHSVRSF